MKKKILLILFMFMLVKNVNAEEIKVGTYKISSASNENLILVENNNNIELGDEDSQGNKLWDIYSNSGYFLIRSHDNNENTIEINEKKLVAGTNIQMNPIRRDNFQKWKLNYDGKGSYYITSYLGNYNFDIMYGILKSGTNIQLYQNNGTNAQKWKFIRIDDEDNNELADGNYVIKGANNSSNVLDLYGANTKNNSNIWMYSNNNSWAQVWSLNYSDGFYKISSILDTNKVVDIYAGNFNNYSNIQLFQSNGTNAQKFKIYKNNDNTYSIRTYDGLWTLDIYGAQTTSGTNLHLYQPNGTLAQKFYFEKVNLSDIESGYYNIETVMDTNKVIGVNNKALSNGKNVELREKTDFNYTKWYIKKLERDIYTIYNADSKKMVLDVSGNATGNGANIQIYESNGTNAQKWIIRKNDDGTYKFIGKQSNKLMELKWGASSVGTNVQIYESNDTNAQKFRLVPTSVSAYTKEYEDGDYIINNINGKALDIVGAGKANGTNVQLFSPNETKAQIWRLKYNGDGEYIISSLINPKLVLTATSDNVVSSKNTNSDSQKWFFEKNGNTTLILNKSSGKYLDINGSNVVLSANSSNNSKFSLSAFNKKLVYKGIDISNHQGNINWANVASSTVDFVVIRAGYAEEKIINGVDKYEDISYIKNVEACEKYNIPYSLYFYSYANNVTGDDSAQQEADHMLKLFKKITNKGYYPTLNTAVYFDQEDPTLPTNKNTLTDIINRFCNTMNNNGHKCGLYASQNWLDNKINVLNVANKHSIWVAQWPGYNDFNRAISSKSSYTKTSHDLWQFSSDGSIPGISGRVDLDIGYNIFK